MSMHLSLPCWGFLIVCLSTEPVTDCPRMFTMTVLKSLPHVQPQHLLHLPTDKAWFLFLSLKLWLSWLCWIAGDFVVVVLETPVLGFGGTGYLHGLSSQHRFIFSAALTVWFYWVYLALMRVQGSPELPGRNCPRLVRVWTLLPLDIQRTSWEERLLTGHSATYACFWLVEAEVSSGQGFLRQIAWELPSFLAFQWDKRHSCSSHGEGVPSPGQTPLWMLFLLSSRGGTSAWDTLPYSTGRWEGNMVFLRECTETM